ncbi:MAG: hypothetical protein FJ125_03905 [Deltaproteobacteria bacterium]|nr:hypothetical protein [Deltaproteobacteria bacterium]
MTYEYVQLSEEAWAALTGDKVAHVLVINEIEKILVPTHLGYVDKVVKAIMPEFPTRRLGEVEVHWQTRADDPEIAWSFLQRKGVTDRTQYQIAQTLVDVGYGATCICAAIRRRPAARR